MRRADLPVDPIKLARYLIGVTLVRRLDGGVVTARIVETEAYIAGDPAGHGFNGMTKRNASLFKKRGHAYVYRIYGAWWCLNVSGGDEGDGVGVLVRAAEPLTGLEAMHVRRADVKMKDLLRGPGRLCDALAIDRTIDAIDLTRRGELWLSHRQRPRAIGQSVRIGLSKAEEAVLRFYERGSSYLSGPTRLNG